ETTLDNMAKGGIYDQVGGGFSRYATDSQWHAPHFEKMLYDNAQLISLYSHAFQVTQNPLYTKIVYETIDFIKHELISLEGGFYSSLDADSEGKEGKFYIWKKEEIKKILGKDAPIFCDYFGITETGNWEEGENIPDIRLGEKNVGEKYGLTEKDLEKKIDVLKKLVFEARAKRIRPGTDDKILTSWNALMVTGLTDAYRAFGDKEFLSLAQKTLDFLLNNMETKEGGLNRNYKNGHANIPAFLDDYAFTINALIRFYQVSFDEKYLSKAKELTDYTIDHFFDKTSGLFFYTDDQYSDLIARKMEVSDNVIPSSNSEMAKNILILGLFFENKDFENKSLQMVKNVADDIQKTPGYYSNWAQVMALEIHSPFEVAIVGNDWQQKLSQMQIKYLPNAIFLGGNSEGDLPLLESKLQPGKTMIYVCENKTCQRPVEEVEEAFEQIESK
ncbi:MAG: glycoside hydrolase family 88 protein, partial [Ginsengibacter sp.]